MLWLTVRTFQIVVKLDVRSLFAWNEKRKHLKLIILSRTQIKQAVTVLSSLKDFLFFQNIHKKWADIHNPFVLLMVLFFFVLISILPCFFSRGKMQRELEEMKDKLSKKAEDMAKKDEEITEIERQRKEE